MITRACRKCGAIHELQDRFFRQVFGRNKTTKYYKWVCRDCERSFSRDYQSKHPEKARLNNKKALERNPNYQKQWRELNAERLREYRRQHESRPNIKLKKRISRAIHHALKRKEAIKTINTLSFLPYTIDELKRHLESQFEFWMSWENWGQYNPSTWDDNDSKTWTWQLDHKIPMATYTYSCQEDPGFLEAWKLENLRPLKAKDNIILGAKMKRNHFQNLDIHSKGVIDG